MLRLAKAVPFRESGGYVGSAKAESDPVGIVIALAITTGRRKGTPRGGITLQSRQSRASLCLSAKADGIPSGLL